MTTSSTNREQERRERRRSENPGRGWRETWSRKDEVESERPFFFFSENKVFRDSTFFLFFPVFPKTPNLLAPLHNTALLS